MLIPPGLAEYPIKGSCLSSCTSKLPGNLNVFAWVSHGHMLLRSALTTLHNPTGEEYNFGDKNYDFNRQNSHPVNPMWVIKPGFSANTTCIYDSRKRTNTTMGGDGSEDEMCYNLVFYYPKENGLAYCLHAEKNVNLKCMFNSKVTIDNY
jgi:hypothetical protein